MSADLPSGVSEAGPFDSTYTHGFARVAAAIPLIAVGDVERNVA